MSGYEGRYFMSQTLCPDCGRELDSESAPCPECTTAIEGVEGRGQSTTLAKVVFVLLIVGLLITIAVVITIIIR